MLSFRSQDNTFATAVKKQAKVDTKFFLSCRILLDLHISFFSFPDFQIFCPGLPEQANICHNAAQSPSNFNTLTFTITYKHFSDR